VIKSKYDLLQNEPVDKNGLEPFLKAKEYKKEAEYPASILCCSVSLSFFRYDSQSLMFSLLCSDYL
jgi:hypothetical protein